MSSGKFIRNLLENEEKHDKKKILTLLEHRKKCRERERNPIKISWRHPELH